MSSLTFAYPAHLARDEAGRILVGFRDLPACHTDGADRQEALAEAADALAAELLTRADGGETMPPPSAARPGDVLIAVPADLAAKIALRALLPRRGLSQVRLAAELGCDEKAVRRLLDPRHASRAEALDRALAVLGATRTVTITDGAAAPDRLRAAQ